MIFRQAGFHETIETFPKYSLSQNIENNDIRNKPKPSHDAKDKPSASEGSKTMSILDMLAQGRDIVTSKLSNLVSSVVSTRQSMLCGIQTAVGNKLGFLEGIIGTEALKRAGSEGCKEEDDD